MLNNLNVKLAATVTFMILQINPNAYPSLQKDNKVMWIIVTNMKKIH